MMSGYNEVVWFRSSGTVLSNKTSINLVKRLHCVWLCCLNKVLVPYDTPGIQNYFQWHIEDLGFTYKFCCDSNVCQHFTQF